jgi:branched-subunit amino acid permease
MSSNYWCSFLSFFLIVMLTSLGVFAFLKQKQANLAANIDDSAWFLIILLIIAILSIGSFIGFIFLRGFTG